jgi:hypothetical protein
MEMPDAGRHIDRLRWRWTPTERVSLR